MSDVNDTPHKGIRFFTLQEAPSADETDIMSPPNIPEGAMEGVDFSGADVLAGSVVKVLFRQTQQDGGFSLLYNWFKPHYRVPQHTHNSNCLYYIVSGEAILGNQTVHAGDGFYVPTGAPYRFRAGPDGMELLEFRAVPQFDMQILEDKPVAWQEMVDTALANFDLWHDLHVEPITRR